MGDLDRSAIYGGIYSKAQEKEDISNCDINHFHNFQKTKTQLAKSAALAQKSWDNKTRKLLENFLPKLKRHYRAKQDVYIPVMIALILLALVFASKTAFSKTSDNTNNLPITDQYKVKLIGTNFNGGGKKICSLADKNSGNNPAGNNEPGKDEELKRDVEKIVANTPMAAMIDPISEKDRTVAAFIVGIAMKESKFGVYAPHIGGHDCFNYWGLKAGGKTTAGGYTCFNSPDEAVNVAGKTIEKMVAKGVRTPAQAISWKCGSSCAGHGAENVRKWISDVGVNFYKINS